MPPREKQYASVNLPVRPFLFTVDQISVLVNVPEDRLKTEFIYFEGRSIGARSRQLMLARNIAHPTATPDWRILDKEFIRWMKLKGYRFYEPDGFAR